jgi:hypothetical protein
MGRVLGGLIKKIEFFLWALPIQFHTWNGTDYRWGRRPSPSHGGYGDGEAYSLRKQNFTRTRQAIRREIYERILEGGTP